MKWKVADSSPKESVEFSLYQDGDGDIEIKAELFGSDYHVLRMSQKDGITVYSCLSDIGLPVDKTGKAIIKPL